MKFKVGDRVKVVKNYLGPDLTGKFGTVIEVWPDNKLYTVQIDAEESAMLFREDELDYESP